MSASAASKQLATIFSSSLRSAIVTPLKSNTGFNSMSVMQKASMAATRGSYFKGNDVLLKSSKEEAKQENIDLTKTVAEASDQELAFLIKHSKNRETIKNHLQNVTGLIEPKVFKSLQDRQRRVYSTKPDFNTPQYKVYAKDLFMQKPKQTLGSVLDQIYRPGGKDIVPPEINEFAKECSSKTTEMSCTDFCKLIHKSTEEVAKMDPKVMAELMDFSGTIDQLSRGTGRGIQDDSTGESRAPTSKAQKVLDQRMENKQQTTRSK